MLFIILSIVVHYTCRVEVVVGVSLLNQLVPLNVLVVVEVRGNEVTDSHRRGVFQRVQVRQTFGFNELQILLSVLVFHV